MAEWKYEKPEGFEKSFEIEGPLPLIIDYDDVHHEMVEVLAEEVARTLSEHFRAPIVSQCRNDDCEDSWGPLGRYNGVKSLPCPSCQVERWFGEAAI